MAKLKVTKEHVLNATAQNSTKCLIATMINSQLIEGYYAHVNFGNTSVTLLQEQTQEIALEVNTSEDLTRLGDIFDHIAPSNLTIEEHLGQKNTDVEEDVRKFLRLYENKEFDIDIHKVWLK